MCVHIRTYMQDLRCKVYLGCVTYVPYTSVDASALIRNTGRDESEEGRDGDNYDTYMERRGQGR